MAYDHQITMLPPLQAKTIAKTTSSAHSNSKKKTIPASHSRPIAKKCDIYFENLLNIKLKLTKILITQVLTRKRISPSQIFPASLLIPPLQGSQLSFDH